MAILNNSNAISSGGYDINNSLRFRASASAYLNRTPASAGNRRTWTWSAWVKTSLDCSFMYAKNGNYGTKIYFNDNKFGIFDWQANVAIYWEVASSAVFRDPSAWYHLVVAVDTTQATASNRVKLYVNGNQITALATSNYPTQNYDGIMNTANPTFIGKQSTTVYGEQSFFDGYMTEVNFVDGSQLTPSSFGETDTTTGSWKPKAYTGTYGTNGFYLKFSDIATTSGSNAGLGKDFSGNANYWTTNNISVTAGTTYDAMIDSPTLTSATVANYPVLNPLQKASDVTISNGNLTESQGATYRTTPTTMFASSGKWYAEMVTDGEVGVVREGAFDINTRFGLGTGQSGAYAYNAYDGKKMNNGTETSYGAGFSASDVMGIALDLDNGTVTFYKNNVSQGTAFSSLPAGNYSFATGHANTSSNVNFGQRPFAYTPPTGFVRLNTYNLPDSTIKKGNTVMDANIWTGNGTGITITNSGAMKPDLMWIKSRSVNGYYHVLTDSVRGITKALYSNATDSENTLSTRVTAINSNGFSLGTSGDVNDNAQTFVGWQWQAGQGSTSSNTSGSITSTVSVNTTAGFSVVTYTGNGTAGATIGHGLGVAPKFIIIKKRSSTADWDVYHASLGATKALYLNRTDGQQTGTTFWNDTAPSSTLTTFGTSPDINSNGVTYVMYSWAEIAGFSKFGSYTGNGSTDGPFIYTGFRPKFLMFKTTTIIGHWVIVDTSRNTYNVIDNSLYPDTSGSEINTITDVDFLSNGFKWRGVLANETNVSGQVYIYMAFAENPFKNSNAF